MFKGVYTLHYIVQVFRIDKCRKLQIQGVSEKTAFSGFGNQPEGAWKK